MKLQKIGLSGLISILAALTVGEFRFIPNSQFKIINSQALAQTQAQRKAEADRLLKQGRQQAQISQLQAALQSWQQALIIYREIKDRQSEGKSLGYLGIAYLYQGDYAKAIEYLQQSLAIAREIKHRQGEGATLGILGIAYRNLGDYAKAIEYQQQKLAIAREIKDRESEGKALGNLGIAYRNLGDYAKAIEYQQQACSRVGMEGFSTHSFRRTALTQMSNAGIPLRVIQKLSGHRAIAVTPEYLEVGDAQVRGAANSLSAFGYIRK